VNAAAEPLRRTLARNLTLALVVGAVLAVQRHRLGLFLPVSVLALWFTLGGHYLEVAFLKGVGARVPTLRIVMWFVGGVVLYGLMAVTARALPLRALPLRVWWVAGFVFIGVELVAHALLALRERPNFYNGNG
jgi:uncharacterized membrane protein